MRKKKRYSIRWLRENYGLGKIVGHAIDVYELYNGPEGGNVVRFVGWFWYAEE